MAEERAETMDLEGCPACGRVNAADARFWRGAGHFFVLGELDADGQTDVAYTDNGAELTGWRDLSDASGNLSLTTGGTELGFHSLVHAIEDVGLVVNAEDVAAGDLACTHCTGPRSALDGNDRVRDRQRYGEDGPATGLGIQADGMLEHPADTLDDRKP